MEKITFLQETDGVTTKMELDLFKFGSTWPEVLRKFLDFLSGCGYILPIELLENVDQLDGMNMKVFRLEQQIKMLKGEKIDGYDDEDEASLDNT